ncbi:MAG: MBL fold metallo-hydrolase [candidate division Zixibacteria bacterium]|nr:MBL fold metallo-hydrolase [candidate division Zixibacteria bacterium]
MKKFIKRAAYILGGLIIIFVGVVIVSTDNLSQFGAEPSGERLERIKQSPNYIDGRFVNSTGFEQSFSLESLNKMASGVIGDEIRTPIKAIEVTRLTADSFEPLPPVGLTVYWLGHNTVLIEIDGNRILTDPVWAEKYSPSSVIGGNRFFEPPVAITDLPQLDAVIISHDHYDHLDKKAVQEIAKTGVVFYMPLGVGAHFDEWDIAPEQIVELDWWDEVTVCEGLTIAATPAVHFSGRTMPASNQSLWATWVVLGSSHRLFFGGDTGDIPEVDEISTKYGPFDVTLMPIGAYGEDWPEIHLTPEQAVKVHRRLNGKLLIPIHWGTYNLAFHDWFAPVERLLVASENCQDLQECALAIPRPGGKIVFDSVGETSTWWREYR